MLKKIIQKGFDKFQSFCERGQECSCWFDGWWGEACKKHDEDYIKQKQKYKIMADLKLWWNVSKSKLVFFPLAFVIGFVMFLGLTFSPISYKHWKRYKKKVE